MKPPFSPSFSLGSCRSRGYPSRYTKTQPSAQGTPTSSADLPAQRMPAQVPAAALEPALLPSPGMPAGSQALAGGSSPGSTSPGRPRQSPACPGREAAPATRQSRAPVHCQPRGCAHAWSRSRHSRKIFFVPLMRSARMLRAPRDLVAQQGSLLLRRLPPGSPQSPRQGT
jgi:hypothetical protein